MTSSSFRNSPIDESNKLFAKELAWFEIDRLSLNKNSFHNKSIAKQSEDFKKTFNYFYNNIPRYLYFLSISYAYFNDKNLGLNEVVKLTGITRQTASQITKDLQAMNLVRLDNSLSDARIVTILPTIQFQETMQVWSEMRYCYYSKFCFPKVFLSRKLKRGIRKMSILLT